MISVLDFNVSFYHKFIPQMLSSFIHLTTKAEKKESSKNPFHISRKKVVGLFCNFSEKKMLKLTLVGRVIDGLPLAEGRRCLDEENNDGDNSSQKQQAEFLLQELSRRALPPSKMTVFLDDLCFNYVVENGICFMALCDSMYPRKLVFCYLQDLHKEFVKFKDVGLVESIMRPYSFLKFDGVIANVRRKYVDIRSQANLSKVNSDSSEDEDVITESFTRIVQRRRRLELFERMSEAHLHPSPIWCSKRLEIIALKWIPIGLVLAVTTVVVWTSLRREDLFSTGYVYF